MVDFTAGMCSLEKWRGNSNDAGQFLTKRVAFGTSWRKKLYDALIVSPRSNRSHRCRYQSRDSKSPCKPALRTCEGKYHDLKDPMSKETFFYLFLIYTQYAIHSHKNLFANENRPGKNASSIKSRSTKCPLHPPSTTSSHRNIDVYTIHSHDMTLSKHILRTH